MQINLTVAPRARLALALVALAGCTSNPTPSEPAPGSDGTVDNGSPTGEVGSDDGTTPSSTMDGGKVVMSKSSDAGASSDAAGAKAKDAGSASADAAVGSSMDASISTDADDASAPAIDATTVSEDAASPGTDQADASAKEDAAVKVDAGGTKKDASAPVDPSSQCAGATPHGCYVARADNPMGCPEQIHEQSEFYPPRDEWVACSSPYYTACNYAKPEGGDDAHCECDLGLHWLCTY